MNLRIVFATVLVTVCAALWAGPGSASASVVTTSGGGLYTSAISAESTGAVILKGLAEVKCGKSAVEGTVESDGAEVPVSTKLSSLTFSECGSSTVTVVKPGTLELQNSSNGNGTLASTGAEIKVVTSGITCIYTTSKTAIGTFTGSIETLPNPPAMDISGTISRTGGSGLCGATGTWTGTYKLTTPSVLIAVSEYVGAKIDITPNPVTFAKNPEPLKIENDGDVQVSPLEMDSDTGFKPGFGCFGATLTVAGAGKSCTKETVKCETPGKTGLYWAFTTKAPFVLMTTLLQKC